MLKTQLIVTMLHANTVEFKLECIKMILIVFWVNTY